jgi:hypothetical protein
MAIEPWTVLQTAINKVPAVKYALAVAGVAAAGAIVVKFLDYQQASIIIIAGVFIAMILMFIFAKMVTGPNPKTTIPGLILLYSVLFFFVIFLGFTVTAFALGWPPAWVTFLGIHAAIVDGDLPPIQPDNLSKRMVTFTINALSDNLAHGRPNFKPETFARTSSHWEEQAHGTLMLHDFNGRISLNGCNGDRTKKELNTDLEFFFPNKDCINAILYFRLGGHEWAPYGDISDIN